MKLLWEWWIQIWPNLAASVLTFGAGLLWARRKFLAELERREVKHLHRHNELKDMVASLQGSKGGGRA